MDAVHFLIFLVHWEVWLPSQAYGHRDFGYQVVANIHYKKWWQRYVRPWFDQAGRKQRRRKTRQEKAAAVATAKAADVVVLGLGIIQAIESESHDRTAIDLPAIQHKLAAEITALNKPTAIFLLHGGMVGLAPELESGAAIVDMGYPGFRGGAAIASVLFGDYNPGGKLAYTVYPHDYINSIPMTEMDFSVAPGLSYRFYTGKPVLPFGWGLSVSSS